MFDFDVGMLMLRLDVGTLAFSTALVAFAAALTIAVIGRRRLRHLAWQEFAGSCALYGAGLLMIVVPPADSPAIAVIGGNVLATLSTVLAHRGTCRLARRPPLAGWFYLLTALAGSAGFVLAYTFDYSVVAVSAIRIPFYLHAAVVLWRLAPGRPRGGMAVLVATFAGWAALLSARVALVVVPETHEMDFGASTMAQALYFACFGPTFVALCVALLQIRFEREEAILNDTIDDQTRALRRAKEVAEAALTTKSRFLAATSHDLRQAVHALRLLMSEATEEIGAVRRDGGGLGDMLLDMGQVIDGMTEQLNALLDVSRLDAGTVRPDIRDCPLQEVLDRVERQFERIAAAAGVDLTVIGTARQGRTDPALLTRIVSNLVSNAVKFSPDGRVVVGCLRRGGLVEIRIVDDGIGIPADRQAEIFEEYKQLDNAARQRARGLGLGLSIVRRTADLLGHAIAVRSSPGRGSAFSVFVPAIDG